MLLAIDTSTRMIGLALYDGVAVRTEAIWSSNFHHTVELAPAVGEALSRVGVGVDALQALGVATGPGSFTCLRTGLAFVKGLALARNLPVIGVPSLDIVAASQPVEEDVRLAAVVEAGRRRLAVGWYRAVAGKWVRQGDPVLLSPQELSDQIKSPTIICGELDEQARQVVGRKWKNARVASPAQSRRSPAFLAELAWGKWQAGQVDNPVSLAPVYIALPENTAAPERTAHRGKA